MLRLLPRAASMTSTDHPSGHPAPVVLPKRRVGWGSVERQLPLMMTGVIVTILAIALVMVHATLNQSARDVAVHQLDAASQHLSTLYTNAFAQVKTRLRNVAEDSAIVRALVIGDAGAPATRTDTGRTRVEERLTRLLSPSDTGLAVELWTMDGRRVAHAGRDLRSDVVIGRRDADAGTIPGPDDGLERLAASDSAEISPLYIADGHVYLWAVAPVLDGTRRLGYIARQYRLANSGQIEQLVRGVTDTALALYLRNDSGDVWSTVSGGDAVASMGADSVGAALLVSRPEVGRILAMERPITGTPLTLVLETPMASVLANTRETLVRIALLGVMLTIVGAIISWRVSRRFTTPLASLTTAAESLAAGDQAARVRLSGGDELVRLGTSFNRMVEQVSASRTELEMQTAEADAARREAERTRQQAEGANRAKSDFLRVMSHELRTPLNAIGGYTELMELELRGPITDEQRRDLARIRASQQHLLGLISGVLDLSRIESGRVAYQIESIPVGPLLEGIDDLVGPQAATKLVALEYLRGEPGLAVLADAEKLRQIMLNLISNAIRHTPPEGRITLAAAARDASTVDITVRDTGGGIAHDALERIFEPFVQLDRTLTSLHEGLGLGLSISRDLARGMGGDLTVESRLGEGAAFTLRLPRAEVPAGARERPLSGDYQVVDGRTVA